MSQVPPNSASPMLQEELMKSSRISGRMNPSKHEDALEVLEFIDRVQSRAIQEIQDRGCLRLVDAVYEKFYTRMEQDKTVQNLVNAEIEGRLRSAKAESAERQKFNLTLITTILAIVGLIGYGSIRLSLESYAGSAAMKAVEKHAAEMQTRVDQARTAIEESRSRVEQSARDAAKSASDASAVITTTKLTSTYELQATAKEVIAVLNAAAEAAKNDVKGRSLTTIAEIAESANAAGKKASDVASTKIAAFTTEMDATVTSAAKAIDRKVNAAKVEIDDIVKDAAKQANRGLSASTSNNLPLISDVKKGDETANMMVYAALMNVFRQRNFESLPEFIAKNNAKANVDEINMAVRTMFDHIESYSPEQRLDSLNASIQTLGETVDQYQVLVEGLFAAVRVQDASFTRRVTEALTKHPLYGAVDSKFADFGIKVAAKKSLGENPEDLHALFSKVDQSNLTSRGLSNLLYVAKVAGIEPIKIAEVERKLVAKLIAKSPVSGYMDYSDALSIAVGLTTPPIASVSDVADRLKDMEGKVLSDEYADRDPWDLKMLISDLEKQKK
jgi:hypothetical protein